MHTPAELDDIMEKWKKCKARDKSIVIAAFLNECGEHATWEDWLAFLHKYRQVKGFEWTLSVD
jgi:hypothetical protein